VSIPLYLRKGRHGAVHEEAAQVRITSFADAEQPRLSARRMLPWNKPEPGGQIAAFRKPFILLEHRMGFEPMNTGFADQRVSHFAIGASGVILSESAADLHRVIA